MKLYDFTLFNNEYDTLDIRLKYMKNFIDKFFVCEINITHQSGPSEFYSKYFIENYPIARELIDQGRLEFVSLELEPSNEYFLVEVNHRKKFTEWVIKNVKDEYIGILTDCDEIVSSDIMNHIQSIEGIKSLDMKMYYFAADNWSKNHPWRFPKIFKSSELKFFDFQSIRMFRQEDYIPEMGWHFSAFGGIDRVLDKLKSFAHTEFNNENHADYQIIYNRAKNREDYLGRLEYPCEEYDLNNYPPDLKKLILENKNISNLNNILKNLNEP
jgi:beta-1,4-mannosyl-glycoprotein beta-1,4-N-acetylglucosaminyltransferase